MFKRIEGLQRERLIAIQVDGREVHARDGEMLAMVLFNAGVVPFRHTPVSGAPRAPLCLMGTCFECLVEVDGRHNVQACMVAVRDGMKVCRPFGARTAGDSQ